MKEAEPISCTEISSEPKRRGKKPKAESKGADEEEEEEGELPPASRTTTRMTRSKASPQWTTKESLILVNVIAAIDGDWLRVLSSHQKWKSVADNCNLMDTRRNLYQCREKWSSLLLEYIRIRRWNSKAGQGRDPYFTLDQERRKLFGLPPSFDDEVFKAIDTYVRTQWEELDSDTETDTETYAELLEVITRLGSKSKGRKRCRAVLEEEEEEEEEEKGLPEALSRPSSPQEEKPLLYDLEENPEETRAEETHQEEEQEQHPHETCEPEVEHTHETCEPEEEHAHCGTREKDVTVKDEQVNESHVEVGIRKILEGNENGAAQGISGEQKARNYESETTTPSCETEGGEAVEKSSLGEQRLFKRGRKPKALEQEEKMAEEVLKNSQLMLSVATGCYPRETATGEDLKDAEGSSEREFVRYQAYKLMEFLGRIVNILDRYPYLVQKYS